MIDGTEQGHTGLDVVPLVLDGGFGKPQVSS